ncbi:MAG: DUF1064 domain-containing protein [Paludibacter sp.]|nr:DUF1064 domain-containing protein [Paludibacter sp.]
MAKNKYNATKYKGYDSKREYEHSVILKLREKAGEILGLDEQKVFELLPKQTETIEIQKKTKIVEKLRTVEQPCTYKADFVYYENGKLVVVDAKGMKTEVYRIKKKLMLFIHGIKIVEV